jgi:hypothetical protein
MPLETAYERLLAKLTAQSDEAGALSDEAAAATRTAYLNARIDIDNRMKDLIERRGGLENLDQGDRFRLTRDTAIIQEAERRLDQLGVEHESIVNHHFTVAGQLAQGHVGEELAEHVAQINKVNGNARLVSAISTSQIDRAAVELGLGTAIADTKALNQALQLQVTREITEGVIAGEGIPQLSRRLDVIPEISSSRGEVISRWATIKGYNLSRQAQYEASLSVMPMLMKQWLCATDERTCPHCLAHHGEIVAVPDQFDASRTYAATPITPYQGQLEVPPLHPRCRCTITAWTEDWRAYTDATPQELEATAKDLAVAQGFPKAASALPAEAGVKTATNMSHRIEQALQEALVGLSLLDDFSGTVRFTGSIDDARLALRNAGFRVRVIDGVDDMLRVDLPDGIPLPRMIRSTKLKALAADQWDMTKGRMLRCAKRLT